MAKDPAFLFYPNDWLGGTTGMSLVEKGAYMELLVMQFNKGAFSIDQAKKILNGHFEETWQVLKEKFTEQDGKFFNERLQAEKEKRQKNARKNKERIDNYWNEKKKNTTGNSNVYTKPIPIENEIENENISKGKDSQEKPLEPEQVEFFLVPEMKKVWQNNFPTYTFLEKKKQEDFTALREIAECIAEKNKIDCDIGILKPFEQFAIFISRDSFYKTYSLKQVSTHYTAIENRRNNGSSTITNGNKPHTINGTSTNRIEALKKWGTGA